MFALRACSATVLPSSKRITTASVQHVAGRLAIVQQRRGKHTPGVLVTKKYGHEIIQDPLLNKGTGFSSAERERLGIRGLLPPRQVSVEVQIDRLMRGINKLGSPIEKFEFLSALQDRNESLFYKLLTERIDQLAPIVYTPTVGTACRNFSQMFRRSRGLFISIDDRRVEDMRAIIYNWPRPEVDVIVVTDGSRILGLGDLGVSGHAIPIGKLSLYVAAGGIAPHRVLPITLDVGTDNPELLDDPLYLGLQRKRTAGQPYFELLDSFMNAVRERWPNALVQFEDFSNVHARILLDKYRHRHLCFNDDIQGTGSMTAAGIINAVRAKGLEPEDLPKERVLCLGAGSAGLGVVDAICQAMKRLGADPKKVTEQFALVDRYGLISVDRVNLPDEQRPYARSDMQEGLGLFEAVRQFRPTILLGLSGVGQSFTEDVIRSMAAYCARPIIFPLSNPTDHAECTAEQAFRWTEGRAIFASGSPFDPVQLNGIEHTPNQGNNMYIFPGVGLGAVVGQLRRVTDDMFHQAALTLAKSVSREELDRGIIYPRINRIRDVSKSIAAAVIRQGLDEGLVDAPMTDGKSVEEMVESYMWEPKYSAIIYQP